MKGSSDSKDEARYDTLCDVNISCKAALDILNDLLCFDKLESGILELHKQEIPVLSFVADCLGMFSVQARDNDVTMSFSNIGGIATSHQATCQYHPSPHPSPSSSHSTRPPTQCSSVSKPQPALSHNSSHPTLSSPSDLYPLDKDAFRSSNSNITKMTHVSPPIRSSESVLIDKFKMDQVVRNLISNALKFTPSGGSIVVAVSHTPFRSCAQCDAKSSWTVNKQNISGKRRNNASSSPSSGKNGRLNDMFSFSSLSFPSFVTSLPSSLSSSLSFGGDGRDVDDIESGLCVGYLTIEVTDTGAGISRENQKKLFCEVSTAWYGDPSSRQIVL